MQNEEKIPLVSIAVATYNGEKYLTQQLDTLVHQTYPNLEIIVSDDGSTDGTLKLLYEYEKKYSFFSVKHNPAPHGIKRNFENALQYCNGEFIAFADQDDIWMVDKIEKMVNAIGDYALVYHASLFVDQHGNSLGRTISTDLRCYTGTDPRIFLLDNCASGHAFLFRKKMMAIALPFPDERHHDWWLAFRAADNGGVKYHDEILVHYRQHQNSQTDFLMLKKEKRNYSKALMEEIEWVERCGTAPGKYQKFIKKWGRLYKNRPNQFWNIRFLFLSVFAMHPLFFIRNKSKLSTFFYILRSSWGKRIKKMMVE